MAQVHDDKSDDYVSDELILAECKSIADGIRKECTEWYSRINAIIKKKGPYSLYDHKELWYQIAIRTKFDMKLKMFVEFEYPFFCPNYEILCTLTIKHDSSERLRLYINIETMSLVFDYHAYFKNYKRDPTILTEVTEILKDFPIEYRYDKSFDILCKSIANRNKKLHCTLMRLRDLNQPLLEYCKVHNIPVECDYLKIYIPHDSKIPELWLPIIKGVTRFKWQFPDEMIYEGDSAYFEPKHREMAMENVIDHLGPNLQECTIVAKYTDSYKEKYNYEQHLELDMEKYRDRQKLWLVTLGATVFTGSNLFDTRLLPYINRFLE